MSAAGKKKRLERLAKKANRHLLTPYEQRTPHDKKLFDQGTERLLKELGKPDAREGGK